MIKITTKEEIDSIVQYIGSDYKSIPYLYVNVKKCGIKTDNVTTWIDYSDNKKICGVYLLYYDCIHFYTKDVNSYPSDKLISFINKIDHKVIMLQGNMGDKIISMLHGYYVEKNYVIDMDNIESDHELSSCCIARREDIPEIVNLFMNDTVYTPVYDRENLLNQFYDRFDSKFSRYFIIKLDGKIVATCSTYGEIPGFALIGGLIVHPDYRRRGLAKEVEYYACEMLKKEGFSKVGFVNQLNKPSLALHEKIGAKKTALLAKFVKKGNND